MINSAIKSYLSKRILLASIIILSFSLFLISCNQQTAQAPSHEGHEGSSAKSTEAKEEKKTAESSGPAETVILEVTGMTCDGCVNTVTKSLESLEGVQDAEVTLEPPQAIVKYFPKNVTVDQMNASVKDKGYESKVKE